MLSQRELILFSCIYRFINCWLVQTSFVPDEYWQSIEPAHQLVFGYGDLTWEWKQGLRNYMYPLLLAAMYKALALCNLDTRFLIVIIPRLAQSCLAAAADVYLYKFAKLMYGEKAAFWTLVCCWLNWFSFFCSTRTLANTVESQLTIIALYYYPWPSDYLFDARKRPSAGSFTYMTIVALATIIRPTSAVFWLPFCIWHLVRSQHRVCFILSACKVTFPILLLSIVVDSFCYGKLVVSLWRFLQFNVVQGGSAHFGVNPWHWYFSNCLPTICLTHIILIAYGIRETKDWTFVRFSSFYVFIHSLLPHKELRFLLPILPPLFTYAGRYIDAVYRQCSRAHKDDDRHYQTPISLCAYVQWAPKRVKALVSFLFVTNLPLVVYTGLFHQRGVLDVPVFLHDKYASSLSHGTNRSMAVWFLTPCYTCPGFSHLHAPVRLRTLDCAPNLAGSAGYVDEADQFHADPGAWIDRELPLRSPDLPTHIVLYEWLWTKVARQHLQERGYRICGRFYNTDFPQSDRQSRYLIIACVK